MARSVSPHHGPTCRPSNPEIGCECGYAEWLDEMREAEWYADRESFDAHYAPELEDVDA